MHVLLLKCLTAVEHQGSLHIVCVGVGGCGTDFYHKFLPYICFLILGQQLPRCTLFKTGS